jgi:hypothetical protein
MSFRMQGVSIPVIQAVEAKPAEPTPAQLQKQVMDLSAQLDALKKQVSSGSLKSASLALPGLAVPVVSHVARSPAASPRYGSRP